MATYKQPHMYTYAHSNSATTRHFFFIPQLLTKLEAHEGFPTFHNRRLTDLSPYHPRFLLRVPASSLPLHPLPLPPLPGRPSSWPVVWVRVSAVAQRCDWGVTWLRGSLRSSHNLK